MSEPTQAEKDAMYATSLKTIASLREQLDAAQQQIAELKDSRDRYQSNWADALALCGDMKIEYEAAQQQIDALMTERNDARY